MEDSTVQERGATAQLTLLVELLPFMEEAAREVA